jgi:hypothetical protein
MAALYIIIVLLITLVIFSFYKLGHCVKSHNSHYFTENDMMDFAQHISNQIGVHEVDVYDLAQWKSLKD